MPSDKPKKMSSDLRRVRRRVVQEREFALRNYNRAKDKESRTEWSRAHYVCQTILQQIGWMAGIEYRWQKLEAIT